MAQAEKAGFCVDVVTPLPAVTDGLFGGSGISRGIQIGSLVGLSVVRRAERRLGDTGPAALYDGGLIAI